MKDPAGLGIGKKNNLFQNKGVSVCKRHFVGQPPVFVYVEMVYIFQIFALYTSMQILVRIPFRMLFNIRNF